MQTTADPGAAANLDPAEQAKFDAHGADWWNPHGALHTLHELNPVRLDYVARQATLAGARVADIGCGGGLLSEAMARAGAQVTGVDLAPAALAAARAHAAQTGVTVDYRECSAEALATAQAGAYDLVTCLELLEHVPEPGAVVQACAALLRPGGTAVFATLSRTPAAFAQAIVAAEYVLGVLPRGTHQYTRLIRPSELARLCRHAGLVVTDVSGLAYNPFTRRASLRRAADVNYLLTARRPG